MHNIMRCSFESLRNKEVINICDGARLGYICDTDISVPEGNICGLIIPQSTGLFSFKKVKNIYIPWHRVEKIGDDIILVDLPDIPDDPCREKKEKCKCDH